MILGLVIAVIWYQVGGTIIANSDPNSLAAWSAAITAIGIIPAAFIFLLTRLDPRMRAIEASIDRNSRSIMVSAQMSHQGSEMQKAHIRDLEEELKEAEKKRNPKV